MPHTYTPTRAHTHTHTRKINKKKKINKSTHKRTERVAKNTQEYLRVVALKKSFGPCTPLKWELDNLLCETQQTSLCLPVSGLPTVCINPVNYSGATWCSIQIAQHKTGQPVSRDTDVLKNTPVRITCIPRSIFWSSIIHTSAPHINHWLYYRSAHNGYFQDRRK